ncbi:hypothetical protein K435DRAFT_710665 [Dendrothele bispora CBS 962.96]|uniref:Polysaccharide lyase 14 domain-containing protein n=1 Tax=Dendrothele bispora (strain CBS 962.96) TaxID=1314807 RepID=A0A4S8MVA3_DENBC|nr:hypothetical protein K435DRAFT_710665 [Dendrothele bispora CBS 962.96]
MPAQVTRLETDFGITAFPGPKKNIQVVNNTSIASNDTNVKSSSTSNMRSSSTATPTTFSSSPAPVSFSSQSPAPVVANLTHSSQVPVPSYSQQPESKPQSILQLFYPKGSINPGGANKGGSQFYATPLNLSNATSVSLTYSVYFPKDFEFVLGGKLPGLYGGHTGCSGGKPSEDCFSTRMMWREEGEGEMYLYAPKNNQTPELCEDPQSDCNVEYGFSLGRGSFNYKRGEWTTINQTVTLNTPGVQDGRFVLLVNGKKVLEKEKLYYRHAPSTGRSQGDGKKEEEPGDDKGGGGRGNTDTGDGNSTVTKSKSKQKENPQPSLSSPTNGNDEGLGGLLGGLLGRSRGGPSGTGESMGRTLQFRREVREVKKMSGVWVERDLLEEERILRREEQVQDTFGQSSQSALSMQSYQVKGQTQPVVGFVGIFFSTFFGGHDPEYASPKDQYVWFKDFQLQVHG